MVLIRVNPDRYFLINSSHFHFLTLAASAKVAPPTCLRLPDRNRNRHTNRRTDKLEKDRP